MFNSNNKNAGMNLAQNNRMHQKLDGPGGMGGGGGQGGAKFNKEEMQAKLKDHFQNKVMKNNDYDIRVWSYVSDVPKVTLPVAYICAFVNVILPGFGTIIAAFASTSTSQSAVSKTQLAIGAMQFMTMLALVGWVWSIYWGWLIVQRAMNNDYNIKRGAGPAGGMPMGGQQMNQFDGGMDQMNNRQRIARQMDPSQQQYQQQFQNNEGNGQYFVE